MSDYNQTKSHLFSSTKIACSTETFSQSNMSNEKYIRIFYSNFRNKKYDLYFLSSIIQSIPNDSEYESDVSSIADSSTGNKNESKLSCEHLVKRIDSLTQENRVLQIEVQTFKLRLKSSQQEIKQLKQFVE